MALTKVAAAGIAADSIDETKLADNSIDSEHYNDGSIDNAHLADDAVGVAELSATGTASTETFLRGDNSWATPAIKTTEEVQDIVGAMFTGNTETNITATYEDSDGTIDLVATDTNTQLSTEQVQDIVGAMFTGNTETNITATYEDSDGTIDLVSTDTNTQLSTEEVQDIVGAMFTGNTETNITATYEDSDGTIDLVASGGSSVGGATGVDFNDNVKTRWGTGNDLEMYYNGSDGFIKQPVGAMWTESSSWIITSANGGETMARFTENDSVKLYHDNALKFETNNDGVTFDNDTTQMAVYLKANDDLKGYIYAGPGDEIGFKTASNEWAVQCDSDSEVALYYDGSKKFETVAAGAQITGDLGIGVAPDNIGSYSTLHIKGPSNEGAGIRLQDNGDTVDSDDFQIYKNASAAYVRVNGTDPLVSYLNGAERMRVRSDGTILIGMQDFSSTPSTSNYGISLNNTNSGCVWVATATTESTHIIWANGNGTCGTIKTSGTSTSYNTSSDYRLKENIVGITDGITRVKQLAPKRFNFKTNASKVLDGFLAHEVTPIVPEAVSGEKDAVEPEDNTDKGVKKGDIIPQGIDQAKLVPLLTAALQEAIAKIEVLETKVAALEAG